MSECSLLTGPLIFTIIGAIEGTFAGRAVGVKSYLLVGSAEQVHCQRFNVLSINRVRCGKAFKVPVGAYAEFSVSDMLIMPVLLLGDKPVKVPKGNQAVSAKLVEC